MVHSYIEHWYSCDASDEATLRSWARLQREIAADPVTERMAVELRDAARKEVDRMLATETPLWHDELRVAGTADAIGIWKGKPTLIDWKTSRREKQAAWVSDYRLQVTLYALAANRLFNLGIEDYAILITVETGGVQVFEGKVADHEEELRARVAQWYEQQEKIAA